MPDTVVCTACLSPSQAAPKETFQEHLFGKNFPIFQCPRCGVTFSVMPKDFPLQDWYSRADKFYSEIEWLMAGASPVWRFEYFFKLARNLKIEGDLLDVGCGEGRFLSYARRQGWKGTLTGLDFNPAMIRRSEEGFKIEVGPLEQFAQNARQLKTKFDVVVLFDVLEHMAEPAKAVAQITTLMKENAYLCVTVPNAQRIRFFGWETFDFPPNHFTRWDAKALRLIVEQAGFEVLSIRTPWCRPSDFSDQFFYPLLAWAMPWLKKLLFGSAAASGKTLTELLAAAPPAKTGSLTSTIADKTTRKKMEIALKTVFSILTSPITLPLCLALRLRRFSGSGLFLLARKKA
jgi:SAM-dependent methyltransferase